MWIILFFLPLLCRGRLPYTFRGHPLPSPKLPLSEDQSSANQTNKNEEPDRSGVKTARIVGGDISERGVLPYIVNLDISWEGKHYLCGGSILRPRWIVTAAHCVVRDVQFESDSCTDCLAVTSTLYPPEQVEVFAGDLRLRDYDEGEQSSTGQMVVVHPGYDTNSLENDIALVRLQYPLEFSEYVQKIEVAENLPPDDATVTCAGWGVMESGSVSYFLRQISYGKVSESECKHRWGSYILPGMWCTGGNPDKRSATGDSGGPLIYLNNSIPTLVGMVSWGLPEPSAGDHDINTDVPFYRHWIEENMNSQEETIVEVGDTFTPYTWASHSQPFHFGLTALRCSLPGCIVEVRLRESHFDRDGHVELRFIDGTSVAGKILHTVTSSRSNDSASPLIRSSGNELLVTVSTSNLQVPVNFTIEHRNYNELQCLVSAAKCDEVNDCVSMSDEIGCNYASSANPSRTAAGCYTGDFDCGNGMCVRQERTCDGYYDCTNDKDEEVGTCGAGGKSAILAVAVSLCFVLL